MIKIGIADDHPLVRSALRYLLEQIPDFDCVGEASDGHEAIHMAATTPLDVLLLDVSMPSLGGIEAIPHILATAPRVRIVVLSTHSADLYASRARRAGAVAYVEKSKAAGEITAVIRRAAAGES